MQAKIIARLIPLSVLLSAPPMGAMADVIWSENFESYPQGAFPGPDWTYTGNSDIYVDSSNSSEGVKSLRFRGPPGGCWEAIPCRPLEVDTATEGFVIELSVFISSDHIEGCHPWTGGAGLGTVCNWVTGQGVSIISFSYDGSIGSRIGNLGTYSYDTWYRIKMAYERVDASTVKLAYWIDSVHKGTLSVPASAYEDDLLYFHVGSGDGTMRVDDIRVTPPEEVCPSDIDGDGTVGVLDFLRLLADWGTCP